jgi:hypothetical protein
MIITMQLFTELRVDAAGFNQPLEPAPWNCHKGGKGVGFFLEHGERWVGVWVSDQLESCLAFSTTSCRSRVMQSEIANITYRTPL